MLMQDEADSFYPTYDNGFHHGIDESMVNIVTPVTYQLLVPKTIEETFRSDKK